MIAVVDWFKKLDFKQMWKDMGDWFKDLVDKLTSLDTYIPDSVLAMFRGKAKNVTTNVYGNNNVIGNQNSSSTVNNMAPATANQGGGQLSQAGR